MPRSIESIDLRRLHYFVTVADELNYRRAAKRLRIASPSLSQQIKTLERELNVQLFERNRNSVALTPTGSALLPHVRALLEHADELRRRVEAVGCGQRIRVGLVDRCPTDSTDRASNMATVSVDTWTLPSHLQVARVSVGNLDLAICHADVNQLRSLGLVAHLVRVDQLYSISIGTDPSPVSANETSVLVDKDACGWWSWNQYAEQFALASGAGIVRVDDGGITGRAFFEHVRRSGRPIVNAPKGPVEPLVRDMVRRPIVDPTPLWTWSLVRRRSDDRPALHAVVETLTQDAAAPDLQYDSLWLPPNDPHHPSVAS